MDRGRVMLVCGTLLAAAGTAWAARLLDVRPLLYERSSHATAAAEALVALDTGTSHNLLGDRDLTTLAAELDARMRTTDAKGAVRWDIAGGLQQWALDFNKALTVETGVSAAGTVTARFPWERVQQSLDQGNPVIATLTVPAAGPMPKGTPAPPGGPTVSVLAIGHMAGQPRMVVLIPWEMPQTDLDRLQFSGAFQQDPSDARLGYLLFEPPVGSLAVTVVK